MLRARAPKRLLISGAVVVALALGYALLDIVPDLDAEKQKFTLGALLLVGAPLALFWNETSHKLRTTALVALCFAAFGTMFRWSHEHVERYDHHDVVCYYLGGKYAPELGPFDLYPAAVRADRQTHRWADLNDNYWAQSVDGFERKPLKHALKRGRTVQKEKFTKERWQQFRRDVLALQNDMGPRRFRGFLVDKGFNATPAWIAYARPIIELFPVESVRYLALIDALLLAGALLFVAFTFGTTVTLWSLFFFCTTISTKWLVPGAEILRYDWLVALMVALCVLERGKYAVAGALTAVAGLLRVFPVVWIFGPGARLLQGLVSTPRHQWWKKLRSPLLMAGVFVLVLGIGEVSAIAVTGVESAQHHAIKMRDHTSPEMISSKRPGFPIAAIYRAEDEKRLSKRQRERMREARPFIFAVAALILLGYAWVLRRKSDVEAFAFGYVPFFLLSTGTYYYHVARMTLVMNHARGLNLLRHRVSLAFLLGLEIFSQFTLYSRPSHELFWTGWLSWGLTAYALGSLYWMWRETQSPSETTGGEPESESTGEPSPADTIEGNAA